MKQKNRRALLVWKPTGCQDDNVFHRIFWIITSPVFLFGVAFAAVSAMVYFKWTNEWRIWVVTLSTVGLAIVVLLLRRWGRCKLLISKAQAKKHNAFYSDEQWLPNRYLHRIGVVAVRTLDDDAASRLLFRHLGEALINIGLYKETGRTKVKAGKEFSQIEPVEFYVDIIFTSGIGYILLEPSVSLIPKTSLVDERIISRLLRDGGIIGWTVERVSYDDLVLFVLKDEAVSRAYDFSEAK